MTNYNLTFKEAIIATLNGETVSSEDNPSLAQKFHTPDGTWISKSWANSEDEWVTTNLTTTEIEGKWRITPDEQDREKEITPTDRINSLVSKVYRLQESMSSLESSMSGIVGRLAEKRAELEERSYRIMHESRISALEEKQEAAMKLADNLVDKALIASADIKTLYGICDNHEEVIVSCEERLANFKIYIDDLYELINGDEAIFTSYNQRLDELDKRLEERHEEWGDGAYSAIVKSMNHVLWENLSIEKRLEVLESTFLMKIDFDERLAKLEEINSRLDASLKINDKDSYGGTE